MVNQQLVDYVKQQLQGGVQKDSVKKALLDAGWPQADVDDSLSAASGASGSVAAEPAASTVNPSLAMGGMGDLKPVDASKADSFFAAPSSEAPAESKSGKIAMIAMGVVIVVLLAAIGYLYWSMQGKIEQASLSGMGGISSGDNTALEGRVTELTQANEGLTGQMASLTSENQALKDELNIFVPGTGTSTEAMFKGALGGKTGAYYLTTAHGIVISIRNSANAKLETVLKPMVGQSVELKGTRRPGVAEITVELVNGTDFTKPVATSTASSTDPGPAAP